MRILNAFSAVATNPDDLKTAKLVDPVNDAHLRGLCERADRVIVGWGGNIKRPHLRHRRSELKKILDRVECVAWKVSANGEPAHPLYQPGSITPVPFSP